MDQIRNINEKELKAIEMKYLGHPYAEIAESVGVEHSTIKSWFMSGGRLYTAYIEYAVEANNERKNTALQLFANSLENAVKTLSRLLNSKDERVQLAAAREIINQHDMEAEPVNLEEYRELRTIDMLRIIERLRTNPDGSRREDGPLFIDENQLPKPAIQT